MLSKKHQIALALAALATFPAGMAAAQLISQPYQFKNSVNGSVGMSQAGQQAIINDKLFGSRPDNMLRDHGQLLNVTKGPDGMAFVSINGTSEFLPRYKGTSFEGGNADMSAGVFNTFFSPTNQQGGYSAYPHILSGATVSTWTGRVVSGGAPVSYLDNNPIEMWTGQVFLLNNSHN